MHILQTVGVVYGVWRRVLGVLVFSRKGKKEQQADTRDTVSLFLPLEIFFHAVTKPNRIPTGNFNQRTVVKKAKRSMVVGMVSWYSRGKGTICTVLHVE